MTAAAIESLSAVAGAAYGCWHGDWAPWNMSEENDRLSVWDWERFEWPVPRGFDELHRRFHSAVQSKPKDAHAHAYRLVTQRVDGRPATSQERATASLYLLDLAARYIHDGQPETNNRLGNVADWLVGLPSMSSTAITPNSGGAHL
jgi:hypothetical protein